MEQSFFLSLGLLAKKVKAVMFVKWCLAAISIGTFGFAYVQAGEQDRDREVVAIVETIDRYFQALQSWEGVGDL